VLARSDELVAIQSKLPEISLGAADKRALMCVLSSGISLGKRRKLWIGGR
jgi:hypothetical protein